VQKRKYLCCNFQSNHFQSKICTAIILSLLVSSSYANNVSLNYSQLEQQISLQEESLLLKPAGPGVNVSFDLTSELILKFDYQQWQDNQQDNNLSAVDIDLSTLGGSLSYLKNNWFYSASISASKDDIAYLRKIKSTPYRTEDTQTTSLGLNIGYNGLIDNWMYDYSVGVQYTDWTTDSIQMENQTPPPRPGEPRPPLSNTTQMDNNTTSINATAALARYWQLSNDNGVLAGAMLSWSYQVSGGEALSSGNNPPPPPPRSNNPGRTNRAVGSPTIRATSGDDSYGQVLLYVSYDLTSQWSIDIDTAIEVASDDNNQSWAIGMSYAF
jgi:hypothetical protein